MTTSSKRYSDSNGYTILRETNRTATYLAAITDSGVDLAERPEPDRFYVYQDYGVRGDVLRASFDTMDEALSFVTEATALAQSWLRK
jgi:hypothetical protein